MKLHCYIDNKATEVTSVSNFETKKKKKKNLLLENIPEKILAGSPGR